MKKWILSFWICLISQYGFNQDIGIKSNLLYDATSTINLGVEFALSNKLTLDISGNWNPWVFPQQIRRGTYDAMIKHWMIQPEMRYWICEKFNGHFVGVNALGGKFNVGGLTFLPDSWGKKGIQIKRFDGWLAGTGFSYGYHWILGNRFSLEFALGGGYTYLKYDKYNNYTTSKPTKDPFMYKMHYFGLTKAGISVVFMLY